jgi:hypothetical protein
MDSGASAHFCPDRGMFRSFREIESSPVTAADGHTFEAHSQGDIILRVLNGSTVTDLVLQDAVYALSMVFTLISVGQLDKRGYELIFGNLQCTLRDPETREVVAQLLWVNGLYRTQCRHPETLYASIAVRKLTLAEAHRVLGHINYGLVKHAIRTGLVNGLQLDENSGKEFCDACAMAKPQCKPFPDMAQNQATEYGEWIHADLWGLAQVESLGRNRYSIDFTDCYTQFTEIDFKPLKSDTFQAYRNFEMRAKTQDGTILWILRSDRGTEFLNAEFSRHLANARTK